MSLDPENHLGGGGGGQIVCGERHQRTVIDTPLCVYIYICVCVYIYICVCVDIYVYTNTHT